MEVILAIEGGASNTKAILCDMQMEKLGEVKVAKGSNPYLEGFENTANLFHDLYNTLSTNKQYLLKAIGGCLSGVEGEKNRIAMVNALRTIFADDELQVSLINDAVGGAATVTNSVGAVLIAGSGSCGRTVDLSRIATGDFVVATASGFGHLIWEDACAYSLAQKIVKDVCMRMDGYEHPIPLDSVVVETVMNHFDAVTRHDIVDQFYHHFNKSHIASLCGKMAPLASESEYLTYRFEELGKELDVLIKLLLKQHPFDTLVAVGSVWNSFDLFKMHISYEGSIVFLKDTAAWGAAKIAWMALHEGQVPPTFEYENVKLR
ncbi:hypothetical protein PCE1_003667 [Barthelona sp. PCE]